MKKTVSQVKIVATGYYTISAQDGKVLACVGNENGAAVVLETAVKAKPEQAWKMVREGDGIYRIINKATGLALDVMLGGFSNGAWLHCWEAGVGTTQLWRFSASNDGKIQICPLTAPQRCVDCVGNSTQEGNHLQLWDNVGGENQYWIIGEAKVRAVRKSTKKTAAEAETVQPESTKKEEKPVKKTRAAAKKTTAAAKTEKTAASKTKKAAAKAE